MPDGLPTTIDRFGVENRTAAKLCLSVVLFTFAIAAFPSKLVSQSFGHCWPLAGFVAIFHACRRISANGKYLSAAPRGEMCIDDGLLRSRRKLTEWEDVSKRDRMVLALAFSALKRNRHFDVKSLPLDSLSMTKISLNC